MNGDWNEGTPNGRHSFRAKTGEILNWWPLKGTIQFQGKNQGGFEDLLATALGKEPKVLAPSGPETAKIFVVHGHDREARDQLELMLRQLGLEPFILQNSGVSG